MDQLLTWLIIAAFYAPLHFAIPMLVVFFRDADAAPHRRADLIRTAVDCALSMTLAFVLVIWLARDHIGLAMAVLLVSMALPYLGLLIRRPGARPAKPASS